MIAHGSSGILRTGFRTMQIVDREVSLDGRNSNSKFMHVSRAARLHAEPPMLTGI